MASFQDLIDESMGIASRVEDRRSQMVRDYARDALRSGLIAHVRDHEVKGTWEDLCDTVAACAFDIGEAMAAEEEKRSKRNEEIR